jgi:starvation-inducible DNA-binding protein
MAGTAFRGDITTPRLGMSEVACNRSLQALQQLLADEFMLYVLLRNAHWSVQSPVFKELHELFQVQYEHADQVFDELAERIRTLGGQASIIPRDLEKITTLHASNNTLDRLPATEIVKRVAEDTERLIKGMRQAMKDIERTGEDPGTIDYLGTTLRQHEKHDWMLRAHLGR